MMLLGVVAPHPNSSCLKKKTVIFHIGVLLMLVSGLRILEQNPNFFDVK